MTGLVAAVVVTAIWSIDTYQRRAKVEELAKKIDDKVRVLQVVQRKEQRLLAALNRSNADEPRLKAVVGSAEVDDTTVNDVARDMRDVAGFDIMLLASPAGALRANVAARGKPVTVPPGTIQAAET